MLMKRQIGAHRFHFTFDPNDTKSLGSCIWIWDAELYDYYLGAAYLAYEGTVDNDGHTKYLTALSNLDVMDFWQEMNVNEETDWSS